MRHSLRQNTTAPKSSCEDLYEFYGFSDEPLQDFVYRCRGIRQHINDSLVYIADKHETLLNTLRWQSGIHNLYDKYAYEGESFDDFMAESSNLVSQMRGTLKDKLDQLEDIISGK